MNIIYSTSLIVGVAKFYFHLIDLYINLRLRGRRSSPGRKPVMYPAFSCRDTFLEIEGNNRSLRSHDKIDLSHAPIFALGAAKVG